VTINDLLRVAGEHSWLVLAYFALPPLLTLATGRSHETRRDGSRNPAAAIYCVLIYVVSVPGALAAVLTGYGLFFLRADLLNVPILVYFFPIASMLATWALMRRQVDLDSVPGFGRLSALLLLITVCFAVAFLLNRLFFGVLFFGSFWGLLVVAAAAFAVFRLGLRRLAG
jgi:hypothetical protein